MTSNNFDSQAPCPCGSGKKHADCCGPLLAGETNASSAEALMRSRFCAYASDDFAYLAKSWHKSTRPRDLGPDDDGLVWTQLEVLNTTGGQQGDSSGTVEFIAHYLINDKHKGQMREVSDFVFEDGQWFYVDGKQLKGEPVKSDKVGRNEPCPCGSGKKYKKCCANK
jgi:SEC-C motif-containing protein